jgi:hypothetical protein
MTRTLIQSKDLGPSGPTSPVVAAGGEPPH